MEDQGQVIQMKQSSDDSSRAEIAAFSADMLASNESPAFKYNKIMDFVQGELFETLEYLNEQIGRVDIECAEVTTFNKFVYEAKKMLVEQKISTLNRLSAVATDRVKLNVGDDTDIKDITTLL